MPVAVPDDVHMTSGPESAADGPAGSSSESTSHNSRPPSSARSGSATQSPAPAIDVGSESDSAPDDEDDAAAPEEGDAGAAPVASAEPANAVPLAKPAKPKSARAPRRSPSPPPVLPPPPQTVRLNIVLGGPEKYEVDITEMAKNTGQRLSTPVPIERDTSDGEGEGDDEAEIKGVTKDEKPRRRRKKKDMYDLDDGFIDDSDLAIDERQYIAQTKQQGFYVSLGEVQLLRERTPIKKTKSKRLPLLAISASIASPALKPKGENGHAPSSSRAPDGSRETPISIPSDEEEGKVSGKRKHTNGADGEERSGKKRKTDVRPFHPELEEALQKLRNAVAKEDWSNKGKFPPGIKPLLGEVAVIAIRLHEYDENFFNIMPRIFPYNRFTMTKLIKRTVFAEHVKYLNTRQDEMLEKLEKLASTGFDRAKEEHERAVLGWERRQTVRTAVDAPGAVSASTSVGAEHSAEGTPVRAQTPTPTVTPAAQAMDDGEALGPTLGDPAKETRPPVQRYRFTDEMKSILWELVCLSNEAVRLENEKNALEGSSKETSEQGHRKNLYQKIIAAFPDGWVSSQQISREVSILKKKAEKEMMEIDG